MAEEVPQAVLDALAPLPAGYRGLFRRLLEVVEPDQRVRLLELSGSVGRGTADAGSDLDVVLGVEETSYDGFCGGWREWLAAVTPTVIAREIPGLSGAYYSVTPQCLRFDIVVETAGPRALDRGHDRLVVFDRDGATTQTRQVAHPPAAGPDAEVLSAIVEEFFRQQAIFPAAVVARKDWLLGVVGTVTTQRMLYDVFVETNRPLPTMGIKQWSAKLTAEQRALLEALPVPNPRRDEVIAAMLAVRAAMLTVGRATSERCGMAWPQQLDDAVAGYYEQELGSASSSRSPSARSTSETTRIDSAGE